MSKLYVNEIVEATAGAGVAIPGHVIQVIQSTHSTEASTTSTTFASTGLAASITPTSSTSKILVLLSMGSSGVNNTAAEARGYFRLMRDASELYRMDVRSYDYGNSGSISFVAHGQSYLDSPSTTSSVTYTLEQRASTGTIRVCEADNLISMQLLEIAQ
jgi:hypothetical protein